MTMAAQSGCASSGALRQPSKSSSVDSTKAKRARTKHACDECRRSQKKCDGDKPLCRRCYLNGTQCTYTPHKSRNQCPSPGQGEEAHGDAFSPDVFVFADPALSSFHTWSATSSPDQSPNTLEMLSPTNACQEDRLGTEQNAVFEIQTASYESEIAPAPAMTQRSRHLYNQRSYSRPNFVGRSSVSPPPHATDLSSFPVSTSIVQNLTEQISTSVELGIARHVTLPNANEATYRGTVNDPLVYNASRVQYQDHTRRDSEQPFDVSTHYQLPPSAAYIKQQHATVLSTEMVGLHPSTDPLYAVRQYEASRNDQDSFGLAASLMPSRYLSDIDQSAGLCAPWPLQGRADGVYSTYSYARMENTGQATSRDHCYSGGINTDVIFLSSTGGASQISRDTTQGNGHDVTAFASNAGRQQPGMTLLNLPRFSYNQWSNGVASPPLSGSYPSSANPSPSAYGTNDFYDWSQ